MKDYSGFVPPCGVFCGGCRVYLRDKKPCPGAEIRCREKKCKSFYVCCIEKKGLKHCGECRYFPCGKLKKLNERAIQNYGQDLIENLKNLREMGIENWLAEMNRRFGKE